MPRTALFLFRRDLRLADNTALNAARAHADRVIACFVLDPRQTGEHPYRSLHALQFMAASLRELASALEERGGKLFLFQGKAPEVVSRLLETERVDAVYANRDYTPFARARDEAIARACEARGIGFTLCADTLLHEPETIKTGSGGPYSVYTPFFRTASALPVPRPRPLADGAFYAGSLKGEVGLKALDALVPKENPGLFARGGRTEGLARLRHATDLKNYADTRNVPAVRGTSGLSAHHKFGTVSVRETYHAVRDAFGPGHGLIGELFWREFFTHLAFHYPHVFGHAFRPAYDKVKWKDDPAAFRAWREGRTGFPLVDAGMRELAATGYMHNRVRMVAASFLTKDLHLDWRLGERHFARLLVDYDPCVNNGNWQWVASTGADAQPYFRVFNPWTQQKTYDPDAAYIKYWVPELAGLSAKEIHGLEKKRPLLAKGYPLPIIDHASAARAAKAGYERALGQ